MSEKTWRVVCYPEHGKPWTHERYALLTETKARHIAREYEMLGLRAEAEQNAHADDTQSEDT